MNDAEKKALLWELAVAEQSHRHTHIPLLIGPFSAYCLVAALQLACRHPDLGDAMAETMEHLGRSVTAGLPPPVQAVLEEGWNPDLDRSST
jgi:hypothetical protein